MLIEAQNDSYQAVIYGVFQAPRKSQPMAVALVAAHPEAGTTYLTNLLTDAMNEGSASGAFACDCRQLAVMSQLTGVRTMSATNKETQPSIEPADKLGPWRSNRDYRERHLESLKSRYNSVLIDCPSLKESTDVLALAPLVDGVLLVVEANRTTKSQVALLERSIDGAGGKILGHLLNKRTFPIPGWCYRAMERLGG